MESVIMTAELYLELKDAIVGCSSNWSHDELIERIHYLIDFERDKNGQ